MTRYMSRCIDRSIERDLGIFGAVLIQGPKWCGKTTTAQRFAESSLSLSDPVGDFAALQLARIDPAQAIVGATPRLIDEWQEEPKLWDAIRFECDRRTGEPGQFLLTGSATPNDADQPMHSGIGRISRLRMETMTLAELGVSSGAVSLESLLNGCPIKAALHQRHRRYCRFAMSWWLASGGWQDDCRCNAYIRCLHRRCLRIGCFEG